MFRKWLRCDISDGQFSDERAVRIVDRNNKASSFFVHRNFVSGGYIQVLEMYRDGDIAIIKLPERALGSDIQFISVDTKNFFEYTNDN